MLRVSYIIYQAPSKVMLRTPPLHQQLGQLRVVDALLVTLCFGVFTLEVHRREHSAS